MALVLGMTAELKLDSRCEVQIRNETNREPKRAGDELAVADYVKLYPRAIHRPTGSSRRYNCHGLSFASRRTWIWDSQEIARLLKEDDYVEIPLDQVMVGDIAVYLQDGDLAHSGLVVEVQTNPRMPRILGKWGFCHEVIHWWNDSPYGLNVHYYRIIT